MSDDNEQEMTAFYTRYVAHLVNQDRLEEATAAQQRAVEKTGGGRERQALLRHMTGDEEALDNEVRELNFSSIPDENLKEFVEIMLKRKEIDPAIISLQRYLATPRVRDLGHEYWARFTLANLLIHKGNTEEARASLQFENAPDNRTTPMARIYFARIDQLRKRFTQNDSSRNEE